MLIVICPWVGNKKFVCCEILRTSNYAVEILVEGFLSYYDYLVEQKIVKKIIYIKYFARINTDVSLLKIFWYLHIELVFGIFSTYMRTIVFGLWETGEKLPRKNNMQIEWKK